MKRKPRHLYLIGFSGSGKSTIAKRIGAKLKRQSIDMDEVIAKRFGMGIPEIFERYGERAFRDAETAVLNRISRKPEPTVVATGGGCVERPVNRQIMKQTGSEDSAKPPTNPIGRIEAITAMVASTVGLPISSTARIAASSGSNTVVVK